MLALRVESLIAHVVRARWISSLRLQQTQIAGYDRPVKDGSADMEMVLWNVLLSFLLAILGWIIREKSEELHRIQILLNKTREEGIPHAGRSACGHCSRARPIRPIRHQDRPFNGA